MVHDVAFLPSIFQVERGALADLHHVLEPYAIASRRSLLVTGRSHSREWAELVHHRLDRAPEIWVVEAYSEDEVARLGKALRDVGAGILIAVGGGGVIDVTKRASKLLDVPCLVIPTVVSNDGLMSPISVLKVGGDRWNSLPAAMPLGVVADLDIIMSAPSKFLRAAAGDLLSNLAATSDWRLSARRGHGPKMNDAAFHLARNAAESLVYSSDCDIGSARFVRRLVVAQIYSGIAMTLAGTSRPCSGPEHLISHALDELRLTPDVLHGIQVGSICFFILHLLGELTEDVTSFGRAMQLPAVWTDLSPRLPDRLAQVVVRARQVRPDRRTLLDELTDEQILEQVSLFAASQQPALAASTTV